MSHQKRIEVRIGDLIKEIAKEYRKMSNEELENYINDMFDKEFDSPQRLVEREKVAPSRGGLTQTASGDIHSKIEEEMKKDYKKRLKSINTKDGLKWKCENCKDLIEKEKDDCKCTVPKEVVK